MPPFGGAASPPRGGPQAQQTLVWGSEVVNSVVVRGTTARQKPVDRRNLPSLDLQHFPPKQTQLPNAVAVPDYSMSVAKSGYQHFESQALPDRSACLWEGPSGNSREPRTRHPTGRYKTIGSISVGRVGSVVIYNSPWRQYFSGGTNKIEHPDQLGQDQTTKRTGTGSVSDTNALALLPFQLRRGCLEKRQRRADKAEQTPALVTTSSLGALRNPSNGTGAAAGVNDDCIASAKAGLEADEPSSGRRSTHHDKPDAMELKYHPYHVQLERRSECGSRCTMRASAEPSFCRTPCMAVAPLTLHLCGT